MSKISDFNFGNIFRSFVYFFVREIDCLQTNDCILTFLKYERSFSGVLIMSKLLFMQACVSVPFNHTPLIMGLIRHQKY